MANRLIVVSPHLDDAAFSCGSFIAATSLIVPVVVVTVFAGLPPERTKAGPVDKAAGFKTAREAVSQRRREDAKACRMLGASHLHLDIVEEQYAATQPDRLKRLDAAVHYVLAVDGVVLAPWGIRHPDHLLVARAFRASASYLYEELPYRVLWSENLPHDLPAPVLELPSTAMKQAAIRCYRSQLGDGPAGEALYAAERYHACR